MIKSAVLSLLIAIGCISSPDSMEEMAAMNTVCIDGVLCLSVVDGLECDFIPVIIDDKEVRCGECLKH